MCGKFLTRGHREQVSRENQHAPSSSDFDVLPPAVAVLDPLRVVLTDWPEEEVDTLTAQVHPKLPELGNREIPLSRQASLL